MRNPLEGMTKLAPGIYDDDAGGMHIDIKELLEANGYADNAENRAQLLRALQDLQPMTPITVVDD